MDAVEIDYMASNICFMHNVYGNGKPRFTTASYPLFLNNG